jgi:hypothetical protein
MVWKAALASALAIATPANGEKLSKDEIRAINATPSEVAATVTIVDDPLNTVVRVSSEPFFQKNTGVLGVRVVKGDKYLRATIDRKTGATKIELVTWFWHGGSWIYPNRLVAEGPDGPVEMHGYPLLSDVNCRSFGCEFLEGFAAEAPLELLEWSISRSTSGDINNLWPTKLYGRALSDGAPNAFARNEIAGFLIALRTAQANLATSRTLKAN